MKLPLWRRARYQYSGGAPCQQREQRQCRRIGRRRECDDPGGSQRRGAVDDVQRPPAARRPEVFPDNPRVARFGHQLRRVVRFDEREQQADEGVACTAGDRRA